MQGYDDKKEWEKEQGRDGWMVGGEQMNAKPVKDQQRYE